jgi:F0F1-type ATP synthase membrane subunit b/b'
LFTTTDVSNQILSLDNNNIKEELLEKYLDVSNNSELIFEKDIDPLIMKSKEVVTKTESKKRNLLNYFKKKIFIHTCRSKRNEILHSISETKESLYQVESQLEEVNEQIEEVKEQVEEEVKEQVVEVKKQVEEVLKQIDSKENLDVLSGTVSLSMEKEKENENENRFQYHSESEFKNLLDEFTKSISEREPESQLNQLLAELNKIMDETNHPSNESQPIEKI